MIMAMGMFCGAISWRQISHNIALTVKQKEADDI
jgi:hypothetical protein